MTVEKSTKPSFRVCFGVKGESLFRVCFKKVGSRLLTVF